MRLCKAAILAAGISVVLSTAADSHHPAAVVAAPITKAIGIPAAGSGAGALAGGLVVGIGAVILVHEITRKRCNRSHSSWVDPRHDVYPKYVEHDGCKKTKPKMVKPFSK